MPSVTCSVCSGVADAIFTDTGPQFASAEFQSFLTRWHVRHLTSSPYYYTQSNGRTEAAVKSVKKLIRMCWDYQQQCLKSEQWTRAMLRYRGTLLADGRSPAMILMAIESRTCFQHIVMPLAPCGSLTHQQQRQLLKLGAIRPELTMTIMHVPCLRSWLEPRL